MLNSKKTESMTRRRFLKVGISGAVVVVVAGVGGYLSMQPQPSAPPVTPTPPVSSSLLQKAVEEGVVNFYSGIDVDSMNDIKAGFEKKYPQIKVEIHRISETQRVLTEHRAKKYVMDAFIFSPNDLLELLSEDMPTKYISPEETVYPSYMRDPNGLWTMVFSAPQAIAYNVQLVKGDDIPKDYWQMLTPRFKDLIAVYSPELQPQMYLTLERKIIGPDKYDSWLKRLIDLNPKTFRGSGPVISMMKTGEVQIALCTFTGTLSEAIKKGDPVDYVRREGALISNPQFTGVYKFAPHPNAARIMKDYLLSEAGQNLINDWAKYPPLRPGVSSKMGLGVGVGTPITERHLVSAWPYTQEDLVAATKKAKAALGT